MTAKSPYGSGHDKSSGQGGVTGPPSGDVAAGSTVQVLVINQHGDNRGDEAALRAMLWGLEREHGAPIDFTIIHQFRRYDDDVPLHLDQAVRWLRLRARLSLLAYAIVLLLGRRPSRLLGRHVQRFDEAYRSADLVISAPGGPYFGDLYVNHEIVHWFYVWLAKQHRRPVMLYAPSAGPFRRRLMNPIRRWLFRSMDVLSVREVRSAEHLRSLLGDDAEVTVTADSALQRPIAAPESGRDPTDSPPVVAVSALAWRYPGATNADARRHAYDEALRAGMHHLHEVLGCRFILLPQLYGAHHSDVPYLEELGDGLPSTVPWEVFDPAEDSDAQQRVVAGAEFCIASRYHPQVFAVSAATPGVCIYYEHKALGLMESVGLERFALDIDTLVAGTLVEAIDEALAHSGEIVDTMTDAAPRLARRAAQTSKIAVGLLHQHASPQVEV